MQKYEDQGLSNDATNQNTRNTPKNHKPDEPTCQQAQERYPQDMKVLIFWVLFILISTGLIALKLMPHDQFWDQFLDSGIKATVIWLITLIWNTAHRYMTKKRNSTF